MKRNTKKNKSRLGILGGTFDPPHVGHLHISKVAIKKLKLNKILWIVTKKNPLKKKPYLDKKIRIGGMVKLATLDFENMSSLQMIVGAIAASTLVIMNAEKIILWKERKS